MGPIQLPFQGKIDPDGIQILKLTDTGNNQQTDMLVAIVFSRTTGSGVVTVRTTDASGGIVDLTADLSKGESAKSIVVPVKYYSDNTKNGVWLRSATAEARGNILLATLSE